LIVGSDLAMTPLVNVKLLDTLVFVAAFVYGFRVGAAVAVVSETVWSVISPWGSAGAVAPFLVVGTLLYAFAGFAVSRAWGRPSLNALSFENTFLGGILAICAFGWDLETNIATGLLAGATQVAPLMSFVVAGIPFMIPHEVSDFVLGSAFAPLAIAYCVRFSGHKSSFGPLDSRYPTSSRTGKGSG